MNSGISPPGGRKVPPGAKQRQFASALPFADAPAYYNINMFEALIGIYGCIPLPTVAWSWA